MNKMNMEMDKNILQKAINKFGKEAQVLILFEELGELIQAVSKYIRNPNRTNANNIAHEIADVNIMIEQIKLMCNIDDDCVNQWFEYKVNNLKSLVEE